MFTTADDYIAFIQVWREALKRVAMPTLAYVLMNNHWHAVVWPREDGDLTRFFYWLTLTHACRWQRAHGTRGIGPVYQGRFKAIPIQGDEHLLTACVYVERNPARAGLVTDVREWRWSSAYGGCQEWALPLSPWPIQKPDGWIEIVNTPEPAARLGLVRACVSMSSPFGSEEWRKDVVRRLGWRTGVHRVGRPALWDEDGSPVILPVIAQSLPD
jgi:putative transposase